MAYETWRRGALDYFPCRYGTSRNTFRGPKRKIEGDYVAFLGGTDTYGRFIPRPFPALVEDRIGVPCINFGWVNAGVDAFVNDPAVMSAARKARAVVLQVPGAQNNSNRYYSVHPRRNDRFLEASALMRRVFPAADFTEFHFTGHMLKALHAASEDRFAILVEELQLAWVARMGALIEAIGRPVLLLWFADHAPEDASDGARDPMFVTGDMMAALDPAPVVVIDATASEGAMSRRGEGLVFAEQEAPATAGVLGPMAHREAADKIAAHLSDVLALQV